MRILRSFLMILTTALGVSVTGNAHTGNHFSSQVQRGPAVELAGQIRTGIMAIGGETTGNVLESPQGTFELELNQEQLAIVQAQPDATFKVRGTVIYRMGVERGLRLVIIVEDLQVAQD